MTIQEIMTSEVKTARIDDTLDHIAKIMRDEDVGAVPVLDGRQLRGLITDRDIVVRCVAEGHSPSECTAEEAVSEDPQTVNPEMDVEEAARLMARKQIRRLPVV